MCRHLTNNARDIDFLILWLDCDREGENICFEVIHTVKSVMKRKSGPQIMRAKFSAITERDIQAAMRSLVFPNEPEAMAVDARQELDLKVGVAFTRFQTCYFQGKYGNLDSTLISYGPCQTPTLGFCINRHDLIQTFSPESFWTIDLTVGSGKGSLTLEWSRGRVFDREIAHTFLHMLHGCHTARVESVEEKKTTRSRPKGLNTVEFLRLCSRVIGVGPAEAMHVAERLYLDGYISYPRTESTQYPPSFNVEESLVLLTNHPIFGSYVEKLLAGERREPPHGINAGDHPPITPVGPFNASLGGSAQRVYDLIASNFIASVSPDCKLLKMSIHISLGEEVFQATGQRLLDPGFTQVLIGATPEEKNIPKFEKGEEVGVISLNLREGKTSPPGYLAEHELIRSGEWE